MLLCNYKIHLSRFSILKIAALRRIWLSKIKNLKFTSGAGDQHASLCQISSKSVKRLQRYGDLTVFKMAAVSHLEFFKFNFFNGCSVKRPTHAVRKCGLLLRTSHVAWSACWHTGALCKNGWTDHTNIIISTTKLYLPRRFDLYQRPSSEKVVQFFFRFLPRQWCDVARNRSYVWLSI